MRRASLLIAAILLGVLPFAACAEDYSGGGGLPGDIPRTEETGPSDSGFERADVREADAPKDVVAVDTEEAGD